MSTTSAPPPASPDPAPPGPGIARVVLDSPLPQLDRLFDYAIPEALAPSVAPGVRVRVPVRAARRIMDGWVVDVVSESEFSGRLAELETVVSPVPVLTPEVWALARRVADRAAGAASDVLRLAVPKRQARVEQAWLQQAPPVPAETAATDSAALPAISGYPQELAAAIAAGERLQVTAIPEPGAWIETAAELASRVVGDGRTAIIAVPDHRDIPRVVASLEPSVGADRVVRLDAEQPPAARYRAFLRAATESGLAIVGTRSVVYAPAQRLGLITIWDDGDQGYQEPLAPGVHVRDAALVRQQLSGCALVLLAHSPSAEAERLVEIGWCRRIAFSRRALPRVIPTALGLGGDRLAEQARIPSTAWRAAAEALGTGPILVQVSRPGAEAPGGGTRTAAELGRAFPRARVIVSDGANRVLTVGPEPAVLVVATRGAEPVAAGGYRAVLLLDTERMLARESMRVVEDALRTWSNAVSLAAPGAPVHLVGVAGPVAAAMAQWRQPDVIRAELAERRALRLPPAVRTATLTGPADAVAAAVAAAQIPGDDVIGPATLEDGAVRTIIRFDYRRGDEVATALRAEILRHTTGRRAASRRYPARDAGIRVRMDDPEPFVGERLGAGRMEP